MALLMAALIGGCANMHVEGTEASSTDSLAKLVSTDRRSRLIAVDGGAQNDGREFFNTHSHLAFFHVRDNRLELLK